MLPYLSAPPVRIGVVVFDLSAILGGIGVLVGHFAFLRNAQSFGFERQQASRLSLCFMLGGAIGSFLFGLWATGHKITSLRDWQTLPLALSSLGALSGATVTAILWSLWKRLSFAQSVRWMDAAALAFPVTWIFLRAACILQHDHAGIRTDSWLAVPYPDWPRYDLAFLEFLFLIPVMIGFQLIRKWALPAGSFTVILLVLYGAMRLWINPLRIDPIRYLGISVDQWTVGVFAGLGIFIMSRMQFHRQGQGSK